MAKRRRPERAALRNAARTEANRMARRVEPEQGEPIRRYARHVTRLQSLETRGAITPDQHLAGIRLVTDYAKSETTRGRLVASYEPFQGRQPKRVGYTEPADTPRSISARDRFERAMGSSWQVVDAGRDRGGVVR